MIFWNVFMHSHREWSVKCRKDTCLDRLHLWNGTIITIIQKIQYFSVHIWLKLLREQTLFQYDCIPSLIAVKMLAIFINNYFFSKRISTCSCISFMWIIVKFLVFNINEKTHHVTCYLINRIFNDEMNDVWSAKCSSLS